MKKLLLAALIGLSLVAVSGRASAQVTRSEDFGPATVTSLSTYPYGTTLGGVIFTTDATHDKGRQPLACKRYVIGNDAPNFNTALSMLLTAFVTKTPVRIGTQLLGAYPAYRAATSRFEGSNTDTCLADNIYLDRS